MSLRDFKAEMRCLHCGEKLPLLKRFSNSHFCSVEHQRLFQKERDQVGLARLLDARAGLHAASPEADPAEPGIEPADEPQFEAAPASTPKQQLVAAAAHFMAYGASARPPGSALPAVESAPVAWSPATWALGDSVALDFRREPGIGGSVDVPVRNRPPRLNLLGCWPPAEFRALLIHPSTGLPAAIGGLLFGRLVAAVWRASAAKQLPRVEAGFLDERTPEVRLTASGLTTAHDWGRSKGPASPSLAGLLQLPGANVRPVVIRPALGVVSAVSAEGVSANRCAFTVWTGQVSQALRPAGFADVLAGDFEPKRSDRVVLLDTPVLRISDASRPQILPPAPTNSHPALPRHPAALPSVLEPSSGRLAALPAWPVNHDASHHPARAEFESPDIALLSAGPNVASGIVAAGGLTPLPLPSSKPHSQRLSISPISRMLGPAVSCMPARTAVNVRFGSHVPLPAQAARWSCSAAPVGVDFPVTPRVVALALRVPLAAPKRPDKQMPVAMPKPRASAASKTDTATLSAEGSTPLLPRLREGMDGSLMLAGSPFGRRTVLTPVLSAWRKTPSELRWLVLVVAVLAGLWMRPEAKGPTAHRAAADGPSPIQKVSFDRVWSTPLQSIRQNISRRAAIEFHDDFRSGLSNWDGAADWSRTWSYDSAGFVRTGSLAFFQPTMPLKDYRLDFVGQIEKRALSWTIRTRDLKNYYAFKIEIVKPGPLPTAVLVRYAVIDGKEDRHVQLPLPISVRNDTIYNVRVDVHGSELTTFIQDQIVDSWTDTRLKTGGIGFFSARGEQARLRSIAVSHQFDALGRLCAYLAPGGIQTANGSVKQ
jgi:hypothetical protein